MLRHPRRCDTTTSVAHQAGEVNPKRLCEMVVWNSGFQPKPLVFDFLGMETYEVLYGSHLFRIVDIIFAGFGVRWYSAGADILRYPLHSRRL